ncbi:metalloproteinase inhibitor 1-like [Labeo rohita]|uniref:metalloproteinase inhibitor 1-like n=1 Tax=Labeo rohita TaxID=84645 RepID=UPI0021E1C477|nr:metalloproteinase inhibitor 1-like [Labeo rohita]
MGVPLSAAVTLGLLFFLSVGLNEQVVKGCRCFQRRPQQLYCDSDTVIQAKITGQVKETKLKSYSFEIIKTFKYVDTNPVQFIVSSPGTCGINLQNEEYLLGGNVTNGVMSVNMCSSLVKHWDSISSIPVSEWL